IADFTEVIRLKPDDAEAYSSRGDAYDSKGDYDCAIADFTEAIRLKPDDAEAYSSRGDAYNNKGDYDRAIADFTEAICLNPDDDETRSKRSFTMLKQGVDRIIAEETEAIRLKPGYPVLNFIFEFIRLVFWLPFLFIVGALCGLGLALIVQHVLIMLFNIHIPLTAFIVGIVVALFPFVKYFSECDFKQALILFIVATLGCVIFIYCIS
ncbi:MAG: tetratricopeptide repeat protein, partial [Planctomycetaceae bacterium]|nr:tetratricopeptide repeat protein [Planctomycetaceae bacterium]